MLLTNDVIRGSRGKGYAKHQELVTGHAGYRLPKAIEVVTCIVTGIVASGTYLYDQDYLTYTTCEEVFDKQYPIVVGDVGDFGCEEGFNLSAVHSDHLFRLYYGVGAAREFL
ncbi:MAG: hypothetical protein HY324_02375 [Chlamydiia bacterium]|nr:hypothetical protein [Chlamydiia bacterium]